MKKKIFAIVCTIVLVTASTVNTFAEGVDYTQTFNFQRGLEAIMKDDVDEAFKFFTLEVNENTENGYAWAWIAALHGWSGDYGNALTAVNTSLQYLPQDDAAYMSMSYDIRGKIHFILEDTTNAINDFNRVVEFDPDNIQIYLNLAEIYYELGSYDMSSENFKKLLSVDKSLMIGYMGLAGNEMSQDNYREAIKHCENAISIQQDYSPAYVNMAYCYIAMKKYAQAIDNILEAIEIDNSQRAVAQLYWISQKDFSTLEKKLISRSKQNPDNDICTQYLASLYYIRNDYSKAIEHYKLCSEFEKQQDVLSRIADCYSLLGQYEEAINYIDLAIAADSTESILLMIKADILYDAGNFAEAIEQITKYIEHTPDYFGGYYRRGFYKDNIGDIQGAIADYNASIALDSSYAYAYLGRADMYLLKGDSVLAQQDYYKVIELDTIPSSESCAQYAYMELGEIEKAIDFMEQIIANSSDDTGCYYDAACLYARIGDKDMSLKMLETAFRKGYKRFAHVEKDDDLEPIRSTKEFKKLIKKYRK